MNLRLVSHLRLRIRGGPPLLCLWGRDLVLATLFQFPPTLWFLCVFVICKKKKEKVFVLRLSSDAETKLLIVSWRHERSCRSNQTFQVWIGIRRPDTVSIMWWFTSKRSFRLCQSFIGFFYVFVSFLSSSLLFVGSLWNWGLGTINKKIKFLFESA